VGSLKGVGKVYLHAVVDTFGSYAFGFLHVSKQPEAAVAVLHNDVLPFYRNLDLPVSAILTDNGREFCGTENHPYELYLDLNSLEHSRTKVRTPRTNGFVERFNGTVLDEFFRAKMRETFYDTVEALQADLEAWLIHYNTQRPPSRIQKHGETTHRNRHVIRQPRRLSGQILALKGKPPASRRLEARPTVAGKTNRLLSETRSRPLDQNSSIRIPRPPGPSPHRRSGA
jgi:transposase InsO family protein